MADRSGSTPLGCLGRILSLVGFAWIGLVLLVGLVGTVDDGFDPALIGGLGVLIVPAIAVIGVGRAIRRRAKRRVEEEAPSRATPVPDRPREISIPRPPRSGSTPLFPSLTIEEEKVAEDHPEVLEALPSGDETRQPPKSSQEMIEEAKKRWSSER